MRFLSLFYIPSPSCSSNGSSMMFSSSDASFSLVSPLNSSIQTLESGTCIKHRVVSVSMKSWLRIYNGRRCMDFTHLFNTDNTESFSDLCNS